MEKGSLQTRYEQVFALGDVTAIELPVGLMLPKAGGFAHYQAEVVTNNMAAEITGKPGRKLFDGTGYRILEMGHGVAAFARGSFYVDPAPVVKMRKPGRFWHWAKGWYEKWWLRRWF